MKRNMTLSWYENASMKHDDGSHGYMRKEYKKIEVAMKLQYPNSMAQTPPKLLSKSAA